MPKFAKRHYEAIALVMQSTHGHAWELIVAELTEMLAADND